MPLTHVARHHGIPLRTVQRWLAQYRCDGFAGLARRRRSDRRQPRGLPPELTQIIEGFALRTPPPTAALVHRQVREVALRKGWPVPNYHRVYRIMKHLDPALVALAHDGSKTYRTTYDLLYRREAESPNALWQADHTLLDIWVRHNGGQPVRPWLTVIMDDYSQAIAGFGLSFQAPSAIQTALILRQAIWRKSLPQWKIMGLPATFYSEYVPRNIFGILESGAEVHVVRGWLGHVGLETTNRYAEITLRMKAEALQACEVSTSTSEGGPGKPMWHDDPSLLKWLQSL
jgi:putative transposase